jgi:hypothetical protein
MWMHHTWGPKFRSGTKGYDYDSLPNMLPTAPRHSQAKGRGEFLERSEGKAFINGFRGHDLEIHSYRTFVSQFLQRGRSQPFDSDIKSTLK